VCPSESSASPQQVLASPGESLRIVIESLDDLDDAALEPKPLTLTEEPDPIDVLVRFIERILQCRASKSYPITQERERLIVTLLLSILADPHHHLNEVITRPLLNVYRERGGRIYQKGFLARALCHPDQFEHTIQYLYDYGMSMAEIARALGVHRITVARNMKYLREADKKSLPSVDNT